MQVQNLGRLTANGNGAVLKTGDDSGKSPFTETREVVACISPSHDLTGAAVVKIQQSADGGTTWTDLVAPAANKDNGQVFMQGITLPNQVRATMSGRAAGSCAFYLLAAGS